MGNGIEAVLVSPDRDHYPLTSKLDFDCTNNMAEYEACIIGIRASIECKIKREENQMADALATLASMVKVNKQEDANENDKRTLRRLVNDYVLDGETLYKRRKDQVLLRCVEAIEAKKILEEVHEGVCETHANGFTMARKIMRFRYFWSTMEGDCINYAKRCHKRQIYGDKIHVPHLPLHVITSPWTFSMWGMDVIRPILPKASNGHRFTFVVIEHFTNWVEFTSYVSVTKSTLSKFLKKEIICRYGMPKRIISDNALNINTSTIAKLPFALYTYRTSIRTSTEATPFSLVYGMETVLPIKVEILSVRVLSKLKLDEEEWIQSQYDQLNLIEGKRLKAICHGQIYQKRMM
ncbi:uncharacterized protein LOC105781538 [Gossypium raimondii]|uniref:uncharacterized protein LOC105781538 n=1 Tax=Gossypium raimondii TaxID=29730 RepID=UPI00063AA976|nr:uncharacterized protein LOC105781538 [Gossypium raimondii]